MISKIELGDCLDLFKDVPDKSVNLVLTDPPYNLSRENNFSTMNRQGLDFGDWDKNADLFSYMKEVFRVLDKNGSFIVFNAWENLGDISREAQKLGFEVKDLLRLEKTNPMPRNRDRRYVTDYEFAIWFVMPNAKWTFNRKSSTYQRPKFVCSIEKGLHPTQKPLKMLKEILEIHSNPNDIVLDCFAGSGTTLLAAKQLNRHFIGFEKDENFYNICLERLK